MSLTVRLTLREGQVPPLDLCSEALVSSDPPLAGEAIAHIVRIREGRLGSLQGVARFEAAAVFDALDRLPPIEGPKASRLFTLLADSDFERADLESALTELVRVSEGRHPFEDANRDGLVTFPVKQIDRSTGEAMPERDLTLNAREALEGGTRAMVEIYRHLAAISQPQTRRMIIDDCMTIIRWRMHFDFSDR